MPFLFFCRRSDSPAEVFNDKSIHDGVILRNEGSRAGPTRSISVDCDEGRFIFPEESSIARHFARFFTMFRMTQNVWGIEI